MYIFKLRRLVKGTLIFSCQKRRKLMLKKSAVKNDKSDKIELSRYNYIHHSIDKISNFLFLYSIMHKN